MPSHDRAARSVPWLAFAWLPLLMLALASPALANDKKDAWVVLSFFTIIPLALFPVGLALHWMLLGLFSRRSRNLALDLREHYWKSLLIGVANGGILLLLTLVFGKKAPPLSALCFLTLFAMFVLGLHGIARSLGEKILSRLGYDDVGPLRSVAFGWFLVAYVGCIPFVGWAIAGWWGLRGIGGVVLQIAGDRSDPKVVIIAEAQAKDPVQPT